MIEKTNDEQHKEVDRILHKINSVLYEERTQESISALSAILSIIAFHENYKLESIIELIEAQYKVISDDVSEGAH